jgi:hypothetical protein
MKTEGSNYSSSYRRKIGEKKRTKKKKKKKNPKRRSKPPRRRRRRRRRSKVLELKSPSPQPQCGSSRLQTPDTQKTFTLLGANTGFKNPKKKKNFSTIVVSPTFVFCFFFPPF